MKLDDEALAQVEILWLIESKFLSLTSDAVEYSKHTIHIKEMNFSDLERDQTITIGILI